MQSNHFQSAHDAERRTARIQKILSEIEIAEIISFSDSFWLPVGRDVKL
jgi:hypothetical protein